MRPLVIDKEAKANIAKVIQHAENNKYPRSFMIARMKSGEIPGDLGPFTCHIQFGFRCVYTVEEQPFGWCHHLSVSIDAPGKVPNVQAIEFLMKEFGISRPLSEAKVVYFEDIGNIKAVNILAEK